MSALLKLAKTPSQHKQTPIFLRYVLIVIACIFVAIFILAPLIALLHEAFAQGIDGYLDAIADKETFSAIKLSLLVTFIAVPTNAIFGIAAAWAVTKHDFFGKTILVTFIDLPFAVSPVVAGLIYILVFGRHGVFGPILDSLGIKIIFATPGIVIATLFVTFPMVARELIPLMTTQGREEEQAAQVLGANGWQMFWRVTLPNIKWGLIYGVATSTARAMGEFGAVSVVSGHIRGLTNTLPLLVEIRYNEYEFVGAFACASLLTLFALFTLAIKSYVEWQSKQNLKRGVIMQRIVGPIIEEQSSGNPD
ncbi:MAG: sulfate ABC transporter permease subunit CysW [Deltaproteobacteria bacterium]|nr:sulfate ABC transporter permease subunit CysW [Deltaproteobacteria bacterium]